MNETALERDATGWRATAWFSMQLGSTLWLLIIALLLLPPDPGVSAAVFALFLVPNILGLIFWTLRDRIDPYPALQGFLLVAAVCALATVHMVESAGLWHFVSGVRIGEPGARDGTVSARFMKLLIVVMTPVLMVVLHRTHRRRNS